MGLAMGEVDGVGEAMEQVKADEATGGSGGSNVAREAVRIEQPEALTLRLRVVRHLSDGEAPRGGCCWGGRGEVQGRRKRCHRADARCAVNVQRLG